MTRLFEAKPFIVAEVGSNWRDLRDCVESIGIAKAVGADAVKFQAFNVEALWGFFDSKHSEHRHLAENVLDLTWLPKLREKADACGIELMCTAFSPELVEAVDPFVSVHKVASSDLAYPQLLKAVAKTGKPVLLSTGASSRGDLEQALTTLGPNTQTILLYCVAAYPALYADLRVMDMLKDAAPVYDVGFSDHTPGIFMAIEAAQRGAVVIEKHFTAFPNLDTPDRPHSLTADEFKLMVDHIRGVRQPVIGPTPEEKAMLLRHNRRLIAIKDLQPGDVLKFGENYGAFRSLEDDAEGFSPFLWEQVEGKQAIAPLARGKGLGPKTVRLV